MRLQLAFAFSLLVSGLSQAASSHFTFDPAPGSHGVGVRVVEQYDYSRSYLGQYDVTTGQPIHGERARPVQTVIWYPAQKGGPQVSYESYARLNESSERFGRGEADVAAATTAHYAQARKQLGSAQVDAELSRPMWAVRDAKPEGGRYPVVIYAPSFSATATENADLCEYLASHGYVVLSSPSMGARTRGMTSDVEGIETQASDIAFLIGYAHSLPYADTSKVAVAGFSWGGIANVFAAARDSRIKALVSLDGSVRYWPEMIEKAEYVRPARVAVPMLFVSRRPMSMEELAARGKPVTSFLNQMKYSDVYVVTLPAMEHFAFSSDALRFLPDDRFDGYTRAEQSQSHGWAARYTLQFLDAYLRQQDAGKAFMAHTPAQNGAPPHLLTVDFHRAEGVAPTLEMLAAESARSGYTDLQQVYERMHKLDPKFALEEDTLNSWGYRLLGAGNQRGALAVLKLAAALNPDSWNAYDSLAEVCEASGDKAQAIANYQRSLQLNPKNANAVQHLKALGAPQT